MSLFSRTKNVFNKWLSKIMSCIFQPVILAITVIVFINVLDIIILRDMSFYNHNEEGRYPTMKCEENVGLFCIINKPSLAFVAAADTITQGFNLVTSIIKGNFNRIQLIYLNKKYAGCRISAARV